MVDFLFFNREQKTVVGSAIAALLFGIAFVAIAYFFVPIKLPVVNTPEQRLIFALRCQIFPVIMLFAGIAAVGNSRFVSPAINPLAGAESDAMRVHLRYLSNTLEQVVLFAIASLMLSTFLDAERIKLIPILTLVFAIGRVTFWIGYLTDPIYRAFGMALTLYPTAAMLFYDVYCFFWG